MKNINKVALEIIKLRKDNNLSQQDLADQVYVSRQAISKYERGECFPSVEVIEIIKELYNLDLEVYMNYDENKVIIADNQLKINGLIKSNKLIKISMISVISILLIFILSYVFINKYLRINKNEYIILEDYYQIRTLLVGDSRELRASFKGKEKNEIKEVSFAVNHSDILHLRDNNIIEAISTGQTEIRVQMTIDTGVTYIKEFEVYIYTSRTDLLVYNHYVNESSYQSKFRRRRLSNIRVGETIDLDERIGEVSTDTIIFLGYTLEPGSEDYITEYTPSIDHEKNVIYCNFKYDFPKITYDLNGGVNDPRNREGEIFSKGKSFTFYDPTREGYSFKRWIVVYEGKVEYYSPTLLFGFSMRISSDVYLIAEWEKRN